MTDYWKYVKPDPRGLEENPYINPPKAATLRTSTTPAPASRTPPGETTILNLDNFLKLENVKCTDSKGKVFEHYDALFVRKDIERDSNNPDNKTNQVNFTPYNATAHFESKGLFLPSFALSCNILAALYANKSDPEVAQVLMQYKNKGNGTGYHAQNTMVDWGAKKIIHYPNKDDYTSAGGNQVINSQKVRTPLAFDNSGFSNATLEAALRNPNYREFIQNLSGMQNPDLLVEIGVHFVKPAYSWISSSNEKRAAWLGC
ncbi:hypothetical protein JW826_06135, partial [Candidatus Woesearchaeota archaeon]|nr:hypothetical protein [Candidatus Woesearchaeota archaeon]